jgi:hypothetical protein
VTGPRAGAAWFGGPEQSSEVELVFNGVERRCFPGDELFVVASVDPSVSTGGSPGPSIGYSESASDFDGLLVVS